MINALTIDLEEPAWAVNLRDNPRKMKEFSARFRKSVLKLMDFLDMAKVRGTFFVLGSVADEYPDLVEEADRRGHRLGIHSYLHRHLDTLTDSDYREDIGRVKGAVESITNKKVLSHRAPTWSIVRSTLWALDILEEFGIRYDSSIYPIELSVCGMRGIPSYPFKIKHKKIIEFPPGVVKFSGFAVPFSGGQFLNLLPMSVIRLGYKKNHEEGYPAMLYVHPWEQDIVESEKESARIMNLTHMEENLEIAISRIERIIGEFEFAPMEEVLEQVKEMETINIYPF